MIKQIKEVFWFQLLNRCPICKKKVEVLNYTGGSTPPYCCNFCGWGKNGKDNINTSKNQ